MTGVVDYNRDYSFVAKLADWGIRMHMGFLFGWLNQCAVRRRGGLGDRDRPRISNVVAAPPDPRFGLGRRTTSATRRLRRQHPAVVVAVVVTAVAVGVFLPLLGLSLAAFLVVDAVVAGLKANRT